MGVVGPVRTGKSTFIKRFMDVMVLPHLTEKNGLTMTRDELPQSASGKTIMTTEPKFIPKDAVGIRLSADVEVKIRLVDCVGYMVDGATGHMEDEKERQVKTPWYPTAIPFTQAADIGTNKVIQDHATIGIVVTTDGSIGEIPRENFCQAEQKTIEELKAIGKPFVVLVNSKHPYDEKTVEIAESIRQEHEVATLPVNCEQLREEDIYRIMESVLYEFPVSEVHFLIPKWVEMLKRDHKIKQSLIGVVKELLDQLPDIRHATKEWNPMDYECPYIERIKIEDISMSTGLVKVRIDVKEAYYYELLSEVTGSAIPGEFELIQTLKEWSKRKNEFDEVGTAMEQVRLKGYGVVTPSKAEIEIEEPTIIKQGNKFGVKIHSIAPSIHFIRANIETEIAPIVGSEKQAEDLVHYIKENANTEEGMWNTNIFGKSIETLVEEGIRSKITMLTEESQAKLQDTMQKIVNDSNGGMVCIII